MCWLAAGSCGSESINKPSPRPSERGRRSSCPAVETAMSPACGRHPPGQAGWQQPPCVRESPPETRLLEPA